MPKCENHTTMPGRNLIGTSCGIVTVGQIELAIKRKSLGTNRSSLRLASILEKVRFKK
jgi:hypothetical protein